LIPVRVSLAQVVTDVVFSNPTEVTGAALRLGLQSVVVESKRLPKHLLRRVKKLARNAAFGEGPEQLQCLYATAEAMHEHGHFVRIFRWTSAEVKEELMAKAKREYDDMRRKKSVAAMRPWDNVHRDVDRRFVCGASRVRGWW
jgi:hypothetical protein